MGLFFFLIVLWTVLLVAGKRAHRAWRRHRFQQPARYLSEIEAVDYFRQLSAAQIETLVMKAFRARKYTILDDPVLGRSKTQGYAWRAGKKVVVVYCLETPPTEHELTETARQQRKARAEGALVFAPFNLAFKTTYPGVTILSGKRLLDWFSVLDNVIPPATQCLAPQRCQCGQGALRERVNRAGQPLMVCTRFPDCRVMRKPMYEARCSAQFTASSGNSRTAAISA